MIELSPLLYSSATRTNFIALMETKIGRKYTYVYNSAFEEELDTAITIHYIPAELLSEIDEDCNDSPFRFLHQYFDDSRPSNLKKCPLSSSNLSSSSRSCPPLSPTTVSKMLNCWRGYCDHSQECDIISFPPVLHPLSQCLHAFHVCRNGGNAAGIHLQKSLIARGKTLHSASLVPFQQEILLELFTRKREEDYLEATRSVRDDAILGVSILVEEYRRVEWAKELMLLFPNQCAQLCQSR
jgi:hypothetical protein